MKRKNISLLALLLSCSLTIGNISYAQAEQSDTNQILEKNKVEISNKENINLEENQNNKKDSLVSEESKENLKEIIESLDIKEQDKDILKTLVENSNNQELITNLNNFFSKFQQLNNLIEKLNELNKPSEINNVFEQINSNSKELEEEFLNLSSILNKENVSSEILETIQNAISKVKLRLQNKQNEIKIIEETVKAATTKAMEKAQINIKGQIEKKQYEARMQVKDKIEEAQKDANEKMNTAKSQIEEEVRKQVTKKLEEGKKIIEEEVRKQVENQLNEAKRQVQLQIVKLKEDSDRQMAQKLEMMKGQLAKKTMAELVKISKELKDIPQSAWYTPAVNYVYKNKLMSGYSDGKFYPQEPITRAMLVNILYKIDKSPKVEYKEIYKDVNRDSWYSDAVIWASEKSIAKEKSKDKFCPDLPLNREELASILYNYAKTKDENIFVSADIQKYKDSSKISSHRLESMTWAVEKGILSATENNTLKPKIQVSRSQMAAILQRITSSKDIF